LGRDFMGTLVPRAASKGHEEVVMSNEFESDQFNQVHESAQQSEARRFQEAPGESEAEATRDAFLKGAGPQPAGVASALSNADATLRGQALSRLQQERGNGYVQRVVAEAKGTPGRLVGASQPEMVGQGLLAHELTHVGQQGGFGAQAVQREAVAEEEDIKQAGKKPEEEAAV